jgi:uncharacterized protein involved in exopolysaccharide biosynthesis
MEVEMKEIKMSVNAYFKYLKRNRIYLIAPFILGLIIGISYAIIKKPKYEAHVSFIINENDKGIGSSLLSLAGQSGLFLGGGGLTPNDDKILFLFGSRRIIGEAILKKVNLEDKNSALIVNELINELKIYSYWGKDTLMADFAKIESANYDALSRQENRALDVVMEVLVNGKFFEYEALKKKSLVGQGTGILFIKATLPNEILAKRLAEEIYASISDFYIQNAVQKQQSNVNLLESKLDSVQRLIHKLESNLGVASDNNFNVFKASGKVEEVRLKRDLEILNTIMGELIKNYEFAKITLEQQRPFFKLIDGPTLPLTALYKSKIKYSLLAAFGLSVGMFLLLSVQYFRLKNDPKN